MRLEERPPAYMTIAFRLIDAVELVTAYRDIVPHGKRLAANQSQRSLIERQRLSVATY
jgi:hypothetical protein